MPTPTLLIVEDEIIIARELEARLEALEYRVAGIAATGHEAIRLAGEAGPDLVLMDVVLKGELDGIEAAAEIRRLYGLPVIYLTAYTDPRTLERARVTEPYGYVVKPFSERELHANIEMALYRHQSERRLRRIERWFTAAVEGVADAVIGADGQGRINVFNAAAEEITGWTRDTALGRPLSEVLRLVRRSDGERVELEAASQGPIVCLAADTELVSQSHRRVPVDSTTSCIRGDDERPAGTVSVLRDFAGVRHAALVALNTDVALAAAESMTLRGMLQLCAESVVRNLGAAFARVWTLDTAGETLVLQASAGMYTHLDGAHSRIPLGRAKIGQIARERRPLLTNDVVHDPRITDPAWARREGMVAFAGYPLVVEDRLAGVLGLFARNALTEAVIGALASVARTIAVGVERRRLEEQLRHSQKLEAIGRLAGGVAHDFNNVLTVVGGYAQLLLDTAQLDDGDRDLLGEMAAAVERGARLTRQLLTFGRKQVLAPRVLDLNRCVAEIEPMLKRVLGEDVTLTATLDPGLTPVLADASQVEQILMNLTVNARDAMGDGGRLTIETANVELDETYTLAHPALRPGLFAMLAVSDTGTGMGAEVLAHLFEPFFTTKGQAGTGLGLPTVHGIVSQSGGHVAVYSEVGIGSTFKIYLPAAAEGGVQADAPVDAVPPSGHETVLLVEDEEPVRLLCSRVLAAAGYTVLQAGNGAEALRVSAGHAGTIDLLLTDVVMPEMGGRAVATRLTAERPELRVLFLSGYTDDAVIRHGVLSAETPFLQKPFTPAGLASKVRQVLDVPR